MTALREERSGVERHVRPPRRQSVAVSPGTRVQTHGGVPDVARGHGSRAGGVADGRVQTPLPGPRPRRPAGPGRRVPRRRTPSTCGCATGACRRSDRASSPRPDEQVLDADGRWAVPGLWDAHVHLQTWARAAVRLDLSGTSSAEQVVRGRRRAPGRPARRRRSGGRLRAAHGDLAASADGRRARRRLRRPRRRARQRRRPRRLAQLAGARAARAGAAHRAGRGGRVVRGLRPAGRARARGRRRAPPCEDARWPAAAALGVVGVTDVEWERGPFVWPDRVRARDRPAAGADGDLRRRPRRGARRRAADRRPARGHRRARRHGTAQGDLRRLAQHPDGVVLRAVRRQRRRWTGMVNLSPAELAELCRAGPRGRARGGGARDRRRRGRRGARRRRGVRRPRLARARAARRRRRPAPLRRARGAGERAAGPPARRPRRHRRAVARPAGPVVRAALAARRRRRPAPGLRRTGRAARPVAGDGGGGAPLRRRPRPPWTPEQSLTPAEALAASTDGQRTPAPGSPADLVLLDTDPLAPGRRPGSGRRGPAQRAASRRRCTVGGSRTTRAEPPAQARARWSGQGSGAAAGELLAHLPEVPRPEHAGSRPASRA